MAPYTVSNYLSAEIKEPRLDVERQEFVDAEVEVRAQLSRLVEIKGTKTADHYHKTLGKLLYDYCGLSRSREGLLKAIHEIRELRDDFYQDLRVSGEEDEMNGELEKAGRVSDYLEVAELMCQDALTREESCGAHFREEYQSPEGEALRNDEKFCFVSAWKYQGLNKEELLVPEPLTFENVELAVRSYK
ncbi:Fumarate reductase flavoprotein subunit [compost metagenome]